VSVERTRIPIDSINLNPRSTHLNNITESVLVESRSARTSQLSNLSNERARESFGNGTLARHWDCNEQTACQIL
jgi:hypothetical protein